MIERELEFDSAAYSVDAVQRAAYRFSDRLSATVATGDPIRCVLFLETKDGLEVEQLLAEFRKEVLDQVLRERIRRETEQVRNVILAHAFSNTGLIDDE